MATSVARRQDTVNDDEGDPGRSRTPAGDAFSAFAIGVIRLSARLEAAGDVLARPAGQSSARWLVMAAVEDAPATVAQVARVLGLARQSVQRVADLLERDGLAAYDDNPGHRRARLLRLTSHGVDVLASIQAAQRQWANELGARIGERDLRRAAAIVERARSTLGGPSGSPRSKP
ncbi:MAG TPA: MarR family transcriptional regulator [Candidatus Limnocylindrales bacterium]|jgi:DNA-binding MarR family transcriptional regulator